MFLEFEGGDQSAFEHYDDNLEHSTWLSLIHDTTALWPLQIIHSSLLPCPCI